MKKKALTPEEMAFIENFGYLTFPGLFKNDINKIITEFEAVWTNRGGGHDGKPHEGTARSCITPFIDQSEYLSALIDDPRIDGIMTSLLGEDYNYNGSDGNYYVGNTAWHSDGGFFEFKRVVKWYKVAFYLDPLTRETGALRVIPGSHKVNDRYAEALEQEVKNSVRTDEQKLFGVKGKDIPAVALETNPGDVGIFNHCTKHSSWGGGKRRRMFTINCSSRYKTEHLHHLRDNISGHARFWNDSTYGEAMLRTAGPKRMRHLEQVLANQDHLPEEVRKAKEKMTEPARG